MKAILTIAIPTYNRAVQLQAQLERLLPQLTEETLCCVYDNASTDETPQVVKQFAARGVAYFRATYSGGFGRNFLRCFEECRTDWLWVLSDDDPISSCAVSDVLRIICNQSCDFVHVSSPLCRHDSDIIVSDINQLLKHATLASVLLISAGIYKMPSFRPLLGLFADGISTWGPQFVAVLGLLERQGGKALLSVTSLIPEPPGVPRWSTLDFIVRFSHTPEYVVQPDSQRTVAEHIKLIVPWALLMGLREAGQLAQIRKWQRIRRLVGQNLRSYQARSFWSHFLRNWYRAGHRRESLQMLHSVLIVVLLGWCPARLFPYLARLLPVPEWVREYLPAKSRKFAPTY